jgi:protein involved in polysaccharide export with SLBB domain
LLALTVWTVAAFAQPDSTGNPDSPAKGEPVAATQGSDEPGEEATPSVAAARTIEMLQKSPQALDAIKGEIARQTSTDAAAITDEAVFTRIRQDAEVRTRIAKALGENGEGRSSLARRSRPRPEAEVEDETAELQLKPHAYPYPELPSLRDLYSQLPASAGRLKRFGSDIFRRGTGNADELPMDLPVGPDYVLGPGDALVINLWGSAPQRLNRTIDRQGQLAVAEAGPIAVAGLTIAQAQESIQQALSRQFHEIHVEISLGRLRSVRVYVVGDVQRPGAYDISALSTPLNALYAAGGPTSRGSLRALRQYRGNRLVREIDLYEFLLHGVRSDVDRLLPGDTILVPPVGPQVAVAGMVRRPAIYELKGQPGLREVLDLAGGVLVSATLGEISVERIEAHQRRTMLSLKLDASSAQDAAARMLSEFRVQDGDQVLVASILPYNEQAVYLEGHVFRPGKRAYRDGMTVNDLLRSYQDVMPEPADHAEIIRLQPPDFRPSTVSFNLSEILSGDDPIGLHPFDVVRVFGRYQIDPPKVSIYGEVLRPGDYPMASGMTVAGLVQMAGGCKRSAYRETADLSSYVVQDGSRVRTAQSAVRLADALAGDKDADVMLKPGDVVSIRQITGWADIGASVVVSGEVMHAGTYGIGEGEHLSSVLQRAGGLRQTAYPFGAVLERVQVRELGEKTRLELIRRIETTRADFKPGVTNSQEQLSTMQAMQQQRQEILGSLRSHPASGRLVIHLGPDISKWKNTAADVEMRAGDTLVIPKRPDFVLVSGQVSNATAITYAPGRQAEWYLRQAGGPTQTANKKSIFIVRADGSVIGAAPGLWKSGVLSVSLQPGDSIVVPEKIIGGSPLWRNLLGIAQLASSTAVTAAVVSGL